MISRNRHEETAQRAPSNSKNTWPENYIQHVQTISTKNMNAMQTVRFSQLLRLATKNTAPCPPRPLCKRDCAMTGGNRHKETAQRAPSNSKDTWPENYIQVTYTLFKPLVPQKKKLCILCAVASCCTLPRAILRLATKSG